jgi:hypothetical protein
MVPLFALFARNALPSRNATISNNAKGGTCVVEAPARFSSEKRRAEARRLLLLIG